MHAFTLVVATLGLASASPISHLFFARSSAPRDIVASVDRYAGASCTGKICNIAGSGDLVSGCNAITDDCVASLKLNYANKGCSGTYSPSPSPFPSFPSLHIFFLLLLFLGGSWGGV